MKVVNVAPHIWCTHFCWYSDYRANIIDCSKDFSDALYILRTELKLERIPAVLFKPLRRNIAGPWYTFGYLSPNGNVYLDPKFSKKKLLNTLCHELWHARQMQRGELSYEHNELGDIEYIVWKGQKFKSKDLGATASQSEIDHYNSLPFEIEAQENEVRLEKLVLKSLKKLQKKELDNGSLRR